MFSKPLLSLSDKILLKIRIWRNPYEFFAETFCICNYCIYILVSWNSKNKYLKLFVKNDNKNLLNYCKLSLFSISLMFALSQIWQTSLTTRSAQHFLQNPSLAFGIYFTWFFRYLRTSNPFSLK